MAATTPPLNQEILSNSMLAFRATGWVGESWRLEGF
jgi:hypothetical protein